VIRPFLLLAVLGALALSAVAAPLPQTAPLKARAKSVELDQKTGTTRYRGDVQMSMGRLSVRADYLEIMTSQGQMSEVRANGDPIVVRREAEDEEPVIEVQAQRLEYRATTQLMELFDDVSIRQGQDVLRAQSVRYHVPTRHFEAKGDPSRNQRVIAVYQPRKSLDTKP